MDSFKFVVRNLLRHKLRSALTIVGIAVALFAFTMIQTMIDAWHAGVRASAKDRLVVRNSVSLIFYLPISYYSSILQTPGVDKVGFGNWFGGKYKDDRFRFPQFAIGGDYLDIYPEFLIPAQDRRDFDNNRQGALIGEELAQKFGLKKGDRFQIEGTIFPGAWLLDVSGIFSGRSENTITRSLFFHWEYLNERNRLEIQRYPDYTGYFVVQLKPGAEAATVSKLIDQKFANSFAETLTETETAFQQSFVSLSSTIITALNVVSSVVIFIMLLVLGNTMLMSARERTREYSILKAVGFGKRRVGALIIGEGMILTMLGFALLCVVLAAIFSLPAKMVLGDLVQFFPVFRMSWAVLCACFASSVLVAVLSSVIPIYNVLTLKVVDGLRRLT